MVTARASIGCIYQSRNNGKTPSDYLIQFPSQTLVAVVLLVYDDTWATERRVSQEIPSNAVWPY